MSARGQQPQTEPPLCPPPLSPVLRTERRLPAGSCDTHFHVFGPIERYRLDPRRGYTPSIATLDDYRSVMQAYGIERAVAVQPSVYGFDNRALYDALAELPEVLRGVAVLPPDVSDAELEKAHRLGIRAIRINARNPAGMTLADIRPVAQRIAGLGWHIQFQIANDQIAEVAAAMADFPTPFVIDHFGFPNLAAGPEAWSFRAMVDLTAAGRCWIKLSSPYRIAQNRDYSALTPFVDKLVERAPSALLWALDWPHTECFDGVPDDGALVDLIWRWFPTAEVRQTVLCDNPTRLFWSDRQ